MRNQKIVWIDKLWREWRYSMRDGKWRHKRWFVECHGDWEVWKKDPGYADEFKSDGYRTAISAMNSAR